jgi:hypothetical protein
MIWNDGSLASHDKNNNNNDNNVLIKAKCTMSLRHNFPQAVEKLTRKASNRRIHSHFLVCLRECFEVEINRKTCCLRRSGAEIKKKNNYVVWRAGSGEEEETRMIPFVYVAAIGATFFLARGAGPKISPAILSLHQSVVKLILHKQANFTSPSEAMKPKTEEERQSD